MNYDEVALISLGFSPSNKPEEEEMTEALEESVYQESNYFLKRDFLPKLAEKRIRKLEPLCNLSMQLGIPRQELEEKHEFAEKFESDNLADLTAKYNEMVSQLKLRITRTDSPCDIIQVYRDWAEAFKIFSIKYCALYETLEGVENISEKKRISTIDFVELKDELKAGILNQKARDLYAILKTQL